MRFVRPRGHLGDALLLSAVLRAGHAASGERVGIVRAAPYTPIFSGHPAVALLGRPGPGDEVIDAEPWIWPDSGSAPERAFTKLSRRLFGAPIPETPPWWPEQPEDSARLRWLPSPIAPVLLADDASSARLPGASVDWSPLAARIRERWRVPVVQVGLAKRAALDQATNLSGQLTARELAALARRSQAVIAADPLVIAGAAAGGVAAIALLGGGRVELEAFPGQLAIQQLDDAPVEVANLFDARLGAALDPGRALLG